MNFKIRSAILFTAVVAAILLVSYISIYLSYANFKQDEFYLRLEQKAKTTYKFLVEVKEIDYNLLKVIDRNTINELYNEKVLIFDEHFKLIYSSIDDQRVSYSSDLLSKIVNQKNVRYQDNGSEVVGLLVSHAGKKAIVLASATDTYGSKKLTNLRFTLYLSFFIALLLTAAISYLYVKQSFAPIDSLNKQITRINQVSLDERVPVYNNNDELDQLARNFNQMLDRLESAFKVQRSFIQHASHELRTPLANLITSCEAALKKEMSAEAYRSLIVSLNEEHHNLVEVTNALLLLSKYESTNAQIDFQELRVDDVLFDAIDEVQLLYPNCLIKFNLSNELTEQQLSIWGNSVLLKTAFNNLLRNACKYSINGQVEISLSDNDTQLNISITNAGKTLDDDELAFMLQPFFRGRNAETQKGYGLGLSISGRIVELHKGNITYQKEELLNIFNVTLSHNLSHF
jgi:signal transduction histidine kinase